MIKTCSCIACVVVPWCRSVMRQFGTGAELSQHFWKGPKFLEGAEVSVGHFGTSAELSWVQNVQGPKCP